MADHTEHDPILETRIRRHVERAARPFDAWSITTAAARQGRRRGSVFTFSRSRSGLTIAIVLGLLLVASIVVGLAGGLWRPSLLADDRPSPSPGAVASEPSPGRTRIPVLPGEPWIAYMASIGDADEDRIWLVRPDGTGRHLVDTGLEGQQEHPDWSPNGRQIAFDHWTHDADRPDLDRIDVWVMDVDGANARLVAGCAAPCLQVSMPAWSPDGASLAVIRSDTLESGLWGPSSIEVVDVTTGERRTVAQTADGRTAFYDPSWSPDGASIAVALEMYPDTAAGLIISVELAIVPSDGASAPRVVSPPGIWVGGPVWHPTDDWIVFATRFDRSAPQSRSEPTELVRIHADGSAMEQVTNFGLGDVRAIQPSWAADGGSLLYTQVNGLARASSRSWRSSGWTEPISAGSASATQRTDGCARRRRERTPAHRPASPVHALHERRHPPTPTNGATHASARPPICRTTRSRSCLRRRRMQRAWQPAGGSTVGDACCVADHSIACHCEPRARCVTDARRHPGDGPAG